MRRILSPIAAVLMASLGSVPSGALDAQSTDLAFHISDDALRATAIQSQSYRKALVRATNAPLIGPSGTIGTANVTAISGSDAGFDVVVINATIGGEVVVIADVSSEEFHRGFAYVKDARKSTAPAFSSPTSAIPDRGAWLRDCGRPL